MSESQKGSVGDEVVKPITKKNNQGVRGGDGRPKAKLLWLFFLIVVVLIIGSAVTDFFLGQEIELKRINLSYVSLALLGVLFHLANQ